MLKYFILLVIIFTIGSISLFSQTIRRLPLPDDLSQPVISPEDTPASQRDRPVSEVTIPLPPPPAVERRTTERTREAPPASLPESPRRRQQTTEEIISQPIPTVSRRETTTQRPTTTRRETTTRQPAVRETRQTRVDDSRDRDRPLNPNFIDENMENFNQLTYTIFESLRMQYNYILKLENDINDMRDAWQAERQRFAEEQRVLSFNIEKLEEQNESYLHIFNKLRDDNENLERHIDRLEDTVNSKESRIIQLEDAISTMQQRLLEIRNLTDF